MDRWIEEYRDFLKTNRDWYTKANVNKDKADSYTFAIEWFDRILARNGQNDPPAPPAESLHEAAKRMCRGRECVSCQMDRPGECVIGSLAEAMDAEAQIDELRKWAVENPPKAAKAGVCATCANDGVACGNCKHNPDAVDHFARRKDAPTPPDDGKLACNTCKYEDHDCDETPCVDCIHNDGEDEHYDPAQKLPKPKTYREDFDEKHPSAPRHREGTPKVLLHEVYQVHEAKMYEYSHTPIREYWDKPLGYWEAP